MTIDTDWLAKTNVDTGKLPELKNATFSSKPIALWILVFPKNC
jgi:hypothetical protein